MRMLSVRRISIAILATCVLSPPAAVFANPFVVAPPEVKLAGNFERVQLVVRAVDASGQVSAQSDDLTGEAEYDSTDPSVVTVEPSGELVAVGDGEAAIEVRVGEAVQRVPVNVAGVTPSPAIDFTMHVQPILSKAGCAAAACHASQHGQGGFKLSVFGFDPAADHRAMVRDAMQRRVSLVDPDASLILQKPTMQVSHGGGRRLEIDSVEYQVLRSWIAGGAQPPQAEAAEVTKLYVTPSRRRGAVGIHQQLRVEAHYGDGRVRDVTSLARFDATDDGVLSVDESGLVTSVGKGQASVMVRFEGRAEIATFVIPYNDTAELAGWQNNNFINDLAAAKFRELGLEPSGLCDDATFIRRAFLDAIGTLPPPEKILQFVQSNDADKRAKLIDQLLGLTGDPDLDVYNDAYAAWWTLKWSDLLRNNSKDLGEQGMWSLHNWIKEAFRTNQPFDAFVRELVTAQGSIYSNGPANYFRVNRDSSALTESTAQLFLGVRLECAKCHHHPFEKYSQDDYYALAAFFSRVGSKNSEEFGLFGGETVILVRESGEVRQPRTGQTMQPTPLDGEPVDHPLDRRLPLAKWLTSPENDLFARSVVNRYVGYLLGRGLVEPIDDMRSTNPPSNGELLDALAQEFVDSGFDLKYLIRTVMTSRLYQLSAEATPENIADRRFYSHYLVKRLPAEALLDAIDHVSGSPTKFRNLPLGTRAIELPDAEYPNYFLNTFAKPRRASVCECERSPDENLAQALHTLNGDTLATKISDKNGRVATLLAAEKPHAEIVRELHLAALCRPPSDVELAASEEFLDASENAQQCYEDLLWALMNSKQFLFVR